MSRKHPDGNQAITAAQPRPGANQPAPGASAGVASPAGQRPNLGGESVNVIDSTPAGAQAGADPDVKLPPVELQTNDVKGDATRKNRRDEPGARPAGAPTEAELEAQRTRVRGLEKRVVDAKEAVLASIEGDDMNALRGNVTRLERALDEARSKLVEMERLAPPRVRRMRVVKGGGISMNSVRSHLKEGKIIDSQNYDFERLIQQGIRLEPVADEVA